ncbi:MAG: TIGR04282 family arsenosugar biosynthesis glycosyltransferase [Bacteroidota bacterium]
MRELLIIFVKHPVAGQSKTRLAAGIGHEKALAVYRELLAYTLQVTQELTVDKAVFFGNEMPAQDLWSEAGFPRYAQVGETLGDRMTHAFQWGFDQGYQRVGIIGSDNARLTSDILKKGFLELESHDAVIGPADDGGYYFLAKKEWLPAVFKDKAWSTDTVLKDTLADLATLGKYAALLPTLSDVDFVEDLEGTFLAHYAQED